MTKLQSYLVQECLRQGDFAALVGATQATISKLASGTARPSLDLAFAIEKATAGAVPVASWDPDLTQPPSTEDAA
jgi:DNA-binding XRE family transcriptional regulator